MMDLQTMSTFINGLNPTELSMLATKVVELSQGSTPIPLTTEMVLPYLTDVTALTSTVGLGSAMGVKTFVGRALEAFYPFVQGGGTLLFSLKLAGAGYKSMLGRFEEAVVDVKWAVVGALLLAFLPKAIELMEPIMYQ